MGAIHRGWTDLKANLGGGDDAILSSMETATTIAKDHYDKYINDNKLPDDVLGMIRNQAQAIVGTLDRVRAHAPAATKRLNLITGGGEASSPLSFSHFRHFRFFFRNSSVSFSASVASCGRISLLVIRILEGVARVGIDVDLDFLAMRLQLGFELANVLNRNALILAAEDAEDRGMNFPAG